MGDTAPPPDAVLEAFGCRDALTDTLVLLKGGMGTTWRHGNVILKPADNPTETNWTSSLFSSLPRSGEYFRFSEPIATEKGEWIFDGWCAQHFLPGSTSENRHGRWKEMLDASRSFHRSLKSLCTSPPDFLQQRNHRWAKAERLVWSREPIEIEVEFELSDLLPPLIQKRSSLSQVTLDSSQIIHGDLAGNALFDPANHLPPAIIDFTPYWKPVAFADAMIVIDGMLWYGAPDELLQIAASGDLYDWKQLLIRALLFRALTLNFIVQSGRATQKIADLEKELEEEIGYFRRVADALDQFCDNS